MKREDTLLEWSHINEQEYPIEHEIAKTTQQLLIISQNIATLESGEGMAEKIPRRDDLIAALKHELDETYIILDRQNKVKAMKDLALPTYVPKVKKPRKTATPQLADFNELIKEVQRKYHNG
jgi:hypothetical protein